MPYADPEKARAYQRERKRLARVAGTGTTRRPSPVQPVPLPFRLKTAHDVLALIEESVAAVRVAEDATTLERARAIGYLAGVALRAIETGDLAAQVAIIQAEMQERRKAG